MNSDFTISSINAAVPQDFVSQILEPTGGKIDRPESWFYSEVHRENAYMWTISREDTSCGAPYTTGVRIQVFVGILQDTGQSAKQFILDFFEGKKKQCLITKIIEESDQELFTRVGIETNEGDHHILYSLFWGNDNLDIAVISIAGTTKDQWDTYAAVFNRMSAFEIIDMKRFD